MQIHLEQLPHQEAAIAKVLEAMEHCLDTSGKSQDAHYVYANPVLNRMNGIDIKMETGTGKTYVYTRLMHELYQRFGINKFIIMTPSLAVKEVAKSFILSDYATQHFRELYRTQKINLGVVNAGDFTTKKGKRKQFAGALTDFCEASKNDVGTVNALLVNDAMLGSKSMARDDYDQTLIGGSSCPIEALQLTRPVVIVDEPHRFKRDGAAWANIMKLKPQLILRFGATYPDIVIGSGRSKSTKKDYDNLVYDLNAVESFNQGLVKAIDVSYPNLPEHLAKIQYRVKSATNTELVLTREGKEWAVDIGEELSEVDSMFEGGTSYEGKKLSNDLDVGPGMILTPGTWSNGYQEMMLRQAIDAHFEKERELFYRPNGAPRVKALSLYFIDSIPSYRESDGWLKKTFERLLSDKLNALITTETGEYKEFLEATRASLHSDGQKVHAGYFAEDSTKKGDEAIQEEVDDILRNKEKLLQFKDDRGEWVVRRFLFSKWTLREGWDNPNVFVLAKLRSSGSESSKIQEVGRGLRLPVDELGNRLSDEEFRLHFLVDYSERDFAQKLIGEINADGGMLRADKVTEHILERLVDAGYAENTSIAKAKLLIEQIIDSTDLVLRVDKLNELVPLGVAQNKIRDNKVTKPIVHLRKQNWQKIQGLWAEVSKRFMLVYDTLNEDAINALVRSTLRKDAFVRGRGEVKQLSTEYDPESNSLKLVERTITLDQNYGQMAYGDFLKKVHEATNLAVNTLHRGLVEVLRGVPQPETKFNDITVRNIAQAFTAQFVELFMEAYEYDPLDFTASVSILSSDGSLKEQLDQGLVGTALANDVSVPENYLYDEPAYDSDIEHDVLKLATPSQVLVFGKLPRRSIKVPTFTGGTSSPDFVYAIRKGATDKVKLHALFETKGKEQAALSALEKVALTSQKKLSGVLENVEINLVTDARVVGAILQELIGA